jgi:hypothetical protein
MIKNINFLILCLFLSAASAENEVLFNPETGSVDMPAVIIKGQTSKFSVKMQLTDDLSFEVIESIPILEETSFQKRNTHKGRRSTNTHGECYSNNPIPGETPERAQWEFSQVCGTPYNDQKGHHCEWVNTGWICYGISDTTRPTDDPISVPNTLGSVRAMTNEHGECHINFATSSCIVGGAVHCERPTGFGEGWFSRVCGRRYDDQKGDHCKWVSDIPTFWKRTPDGNFLTKGFGGWVCYGKR